MQIYKCIYKVLKGSPDTRTVGTKWEVSICYHLTFKCTTLFFCPDTPDTLKFVFNEHFSEN